MPRLHIGCDATRNTAGRRTIDENNRPVGAGLHRSETVEPVFRTGFHGIAHFENETVDKTGGLDLASSLGTQQTAQNAIVPLHQLRKDDAHPGLLDEKSSQLRYDEAFVRLQIFYQNGEQLHANDFLIINGSKIPLFIEKSKIRPTFFKIIGKSGGYPKNNRLLCIPQPEPDPIELLCSEICNVIETD